MIKYRYIVVFTVTFLIINFCCAQSSVIEEYDSILNSDSLAIDAKIPIEFDANDSFKEYKDFSLNHRKKVFKWQYFSSIFIFITVMIIVYSGLILSFLHFKQNLKNNTHQENELEIGKSGIKIKSSVIGIIILIISVTFLYLYLSHVYEIKELNKLISPVNFQG